MKISPCTITDLKTIFDLYASATAYQIEKKVETPWPVFDQEMVVDEIVQGRQFKLLIDNQVACVWAIAFHDVEIWQELHNNSSVYIHRIAANAGFRGHNFVKTIVTWATDYCHQNQKRYIRMDTVGENQKLIAHYTANGFAFLGMKELQKNDSLPLHYQNASVCLFEIKL